LSAGASGILSITYERVNSARHVSIGILSMHATHRRPKYLNLLQIRLPLPALVSILHRVSGAVLFLALPGLLWCLQQSLVSFQSFAAVQAVLAHWWVKVIITGLLWSYFHHLCAGIRHLLMDVYHTTDLPAARFSAMLALGSGVALAAAAGALLW
jgi:succinate dehydrogenase / fumarate reductase cytochrome b subunit